MTLYLNGLSVRYGQRPVLTDLCLPPVAAGSVVGLLGANGAGKSTLLRTLAGLQSATGTATLDGQSLLTSTHHEAVGYLPQSLPQGSPLLAYEAVLSTLRATRPDLSRRAAEQRIETVFDRLGLRDLALRTMAQLSGGQRQMVGLAQVLVRQPRLLLLDEPTSALDLRWQLSVLQTVRSLTVDHGCLALVAIHDINLAARFCDRLLILGDGTVIADGPPASALTPATLSDAYAVSARVERCSLGTPVVLADSALPL